MITQVCICGLDILQTGVRSCHKARSGRKSIYAIRFPGYSHLQKSLLSAPALYMPTRNCPTLIAMLTSTNTLHHLGKSYVIAMYKRTMFISIDYPSSLSGTCINSLNVFLPFTVTYVLAPLKPLCGFLKSFISNKPCFLYGSYGLMIPLESL